MALPTVGLFFYYIYLCLFYVSFELWYFVFQRIDKNATCLFYFHFNLGVIRLNDIDCKSVMNHIFVVQVLYTMCFAIQHSLHDSVSFFISH
jgi:hypothetical protein